MTPTEQDKELDKIVDEYIYGIAVLRPYTRVTKEAKRRLMQLITADRKRVALEAKIELINNMLNSSPAILHDCGKRLDDVFSRTYLEHKKSELKAQQEEV